MKKVFKFKKGEIVEDDFSESNVMDFLFNNLIEMINFDVKINKTGGWAK
jgi:hypothetical protein